MLLFTLQSSSVTQLCLTLFDPMDCCMPGFPVHHHLLKLAQTRVYQVGDVIQPSHPVCLLLLPSIFPSIRVFSNESVLHIRWPKYWSFSFSISSSNKYSGLISFRIDWFALPAVQGTITLTNQEISKILETRNKTKYIFLWYHNWVSSRWQRRDFGGVARREFFLLFMLNVLESLP